MTKNSRRGRATGSKKNKKSSRIKSQKVLFLLGGGLLLVLVILGSSLYFSIHNAYHLSILTEGIIEQKQNTIPPDVAARMKKEHQVLSLNQEKKLTLPDSVQVPILMYHYVEYVQDKKDTIRQTLDTTPFVLTSEIQTLKNAGYTFMTASELADVLQGKKQLPPKPILLTFDDGHRDFYTDAFPILKEFGVKATNYVIAGFLGGSDFMTIEQVKEIAGSDLIEVGDHTVHHMWLKGQPLLTAQFEVNQSKKMLEAITQKPIVSFAYPYGAFDNQAIDVVEHAGFTSAVSTIPGVSQTQANKFFLYRIRPGGRTGNDLLNCLSNIPKCYALKSSTE